MFNIYIDGKLADVKLLKKLAIDRWSGVKDVFTDRHDTIGFINFTLGICVSPDFKINLGEEVIPEFGEGNGYYFHAGDLPKAPGEPGDHDRHTKHLIEIREV